MTVSNRMKGSSTTKLTFKMLDGIAKELLKRQPRRAKIKPIPGAFPPYKPEDLNQLGSSCSICHTPKP